MLKSSRKEQNEYNHSFYPDNGKFYCSQYIAEILAIFDIVPMKFGDGEKEVSDYWKKYYEDLGVPVPLDKARNKSKLDCKIREIEIHRKT